MSDVRRDVPSKLVDVTVTTRFRVYGELSEFENGIASPGTTPDEAIAYLEDAQAFYVDVWDLDQWMPRVERAEALTCSIRPAEDRQAGREGSMPIHHEVIEGRIADRDWLEAEHERPRARCERLRRVAVAVQECEAFEDCDDLGSVGYALGDLEPGDLDPPASEGATE